MSERIEFPHGDYLVIITHFNDGSTEVSYDKFVEYHENAAPTGEDPQPTEGTGSFAC